MKTKFVVIIILCLVFTGKDYPQIDKNQFNSNAIVVQLSENVYAEILPEIELLSGVLSQTSWIKEMTPIGEGNKYFQRLKTLFKKYENHEAVEIAQELTDDGFCYDAPPGFVLQLSPLPELTATSIPEYYIKRAGGKETLDEFRVALKNISDESNFMEFFKSEKEYLQKTVNNTIKGFDAVRVIIWLNDFFGYKGDEFHIVFAPAMFPGGDYGAHKTVDNKKIIFQVIRERGLSRDEPFFCSPLDLVALTFHEFGHGFVDPAFEEQRKTMAELELEELFEPVESKMKAMAYPRLELFFNELHLRAMTILAMEDYSDSSFSPAKLLEKEKAKGFYLIEYAYSKLREYKESRNTYSTFKEFLPDLLKEYFQNKDELLKLAE